jgi:hypothetical protein
MSAIAVPAEPNAMPGSEEFTINTFCSVFWTE